MKSLIHIIFLSLILLITPSKAEILKKFEVKGNSRISNETLKVYGEIELNKNYTTNDINEVIKKLYDTKFFSKISTSFSNNTLTIIVEENPIINTIIIDGEKAKKYKKVIHVIADLGNGSMRDALSLLDQSISYGNGSVKVKDIKAMLGLVLHDDVIKLATLVIERRTEEVILFVRDLAHKGENLSNALQDLTSLFHQITIA